MKLFLKQQNNKKKYFIFCVTFYNLSSSYSQLKTNLYNIYEKIQFYDFNDYAVYSL